VAVLHLNKSNAAGNNKRFYTPALEPSIAHLMFLVQKLAEKQKFGKK